MPTTSDRIKAAFTHRYTVERELGSGGMATVYLARDLKHGRQVAIKVLRPELAATLGPDRFIREIEILARLTHPHILPLFDSGEAEHFLFYVMPYVEGESLRQRLEREGKLSLQEAVRVTDQVASALHYAHGRGVIHRDIKPENIMLAGDQAMVADFGIARAVEVAGGERLTETGLAIGTPAYMSPEQFLGSWVDARTDVYALGCVVYEMVGGRAPFEGASPRALLAKHVAETVPGLRTVDSSVPLFAERAVARALAKEPTDRFQSVADFAKALTTETVVARVGRRRLAVLPPTNLTNDPDQAYLVLGLHEALISQLGHGDVAVLARTSVLQYQGTEKPVREIARELGVEVVLESSLFRSKDTVGIQARLIDGATEEGFWTGSYDGDVHNVFVLYRKLAGSIAAEIQLALAPPKQPARSVRRAVDPGAYENYMRGRVHQQRFTPQDFDSAFQYYQAALDRAPDYAPAYAGMALIWGSRVVLGLTPPLVGGPEWKKAALHAVELDPDLAEARQALAQAYTWYDWDWDRAEAEFQRAILLDPQDPQTRTFYSHFLSMMKRADESAAQIERALEIDPFNPFHHIMYGMQLMLTAKDDAAIAQLRKAVEMAPHNVLSHVGLACSHYRMGMIAEAAADYAEFFSLLGDTTLPNALRQSDATGGPQRGMLRAAELLAERARTTYVKPNHISILFDWGGDIERALFWNERAYELKDHDMAYLAVIPRSRDLSADRRFHQMLRRMNLPT